MITIDAARAPGMDGEVGSLEPGKKADLVILNARRTHLAPAILPLLRIVGHASGHDVETVVVDGRFVMEDGVVGGVDEDAILDGAERAFAATFERAGFADPNGLHPDTWHAVRDGPG